VLFSHGHKKAFLVPDFTKKCPKYRIGGEMVTILASSVVDRGFEPRSGQAKDYEIRICCFSDKLTVQCYLVMDIKKHFWYLIYVERQKENGNSTSADATVDAIEDD
jgi:hypothetical protein